MTSFILNIWKGGKKPPITFAPNVSWYRSGTLHRSICYTNLSRQIFPMHCKCSRESPAFSCLVFRSKACRIGVAFCKSIPRNHLDFHATNRCLFLMFPVVLQKKEHQEFWSSPDWFWFDVQHTHDVCWCGAKHESKSAWERWHPFNFGGNVNPVSGQGFYCVMHLLRL